MWGALSDERTCRSLTIAAGPRQSGHFRVRVPWDSRPYFTVSDSRLPFSSPPTTRRATLEVFDSASTRDALELITCPLCITRGETNRDHNLAQFVCYSVSIRCYETCVNVAAMIWLLQVYPLARIRALANRCLAMDYSVFQASRPT
jgi:hypothetical protein